MKNCININRNFGFRLSYLHKENICADRIVNEFLTNGLIWWNQLPNYSLEDFFRDTLNLSNQCSITNGRYLNHLTIWP
jgi:hypothetical protein